MLFSMRNESNNKKISELLLLGDMPDVFRHLKVKQLPPILDNCASDVDVMYKLLFEKKLIELAPTTAKMLSDLLQLIRAEAFENKTSCSYMDIGIRLLEYFHKVSVSHCRRGVGGR